MQERCADLPPDDGGSARRHNQALVALARQCWTGQQRLEWALARICETAAAVLEVDRVNVWRLHPEHGVLRCIHAYDRRSGAHNDPGYDEAFDANNEYGRRLDEVRVIDAIDVHRDTGLATLRAYFERHQVASLLDAPVRGEGAMLGVVCHEQVGRPRSWSEADRAFAASIGDCVAMVAEIHRRHAAERRLRYLELHDPQTNLPNRDHLLEVAHSALRPAGRGEPAITAIHLQVDTGDAGHAALVVVAAALREGLGEDATLARVRDDAFALVPHRSLGEAEALEFAGRCVELAERAGSAGQGLRAVAGIAFSHDLAAPSADMLLRNAELASHRVRSLGRLERCEVFDAGRHRGLLARMHLERALRDAFDQGRLHVHYQPQVHLADDRILGAEALLRWRDDGGRWRPTSEFIDVAEASGLIVPLGRWLLGAACRAAAAWPDAPEALTLAVNISARQLEQPGLVADVAAALDASGLAPGRLWLELTETVLLSDAPFAIETLGRLRDLGVRVALDDFGTGHSSFARLKHLPIDGLKIDRSFVADLPGNALDMAIVGAIATIGRRARLCVVAEGLETAAQARAVMDCGVPCGQGYHYGRPMPEPDLRAMFARQHWHPRT